MDGDVARDRPDVAPVSRSTSPMLRTGSRPDENPQERDVDVLGEERWPYRIAATS